MVFGFWTQDDKVIINGPGGQVRIKPEQAIELAKAVLVRYLPPRPPAVDIELPDGEYEVHSDIEGEKHIKRTSTEPNDPW